MRRYPKYKPSGVDWIEEIPEHWEIWKIKHTSYVKGRIGWDGLRSDEFFENEYAYLVTGTDFINGLVNWETCYQITKERYLQDRHIQLKEEDLLITKDGTIGKTAVVKELKGYASLNSGVFVVRPLRKYKSDFLYYILNSNVFTQFIKITTTGTTISHLYQNIFEVFSFTIPPISEQERITDFLDYKTEQCDRFIANRQKQIELLNEQLHFKINQAITKGINSKVKIKPTDIKYVPEIPEHWDIRKFKSLTSILTCGVAATPEYVEESEGVAFLSAQNCRPFEMDLSKYNYIKPSLHKQLTRYKKPQKGDVLVTRVGAGIGQACIIDTDLEFSIYVSLTHIRPNKDILSEYIVYFFNTEYCYQLNHEGTVVAGGQGNLNVKNVERYRIPLPPIEEQKEIVTYLDNYRKEMDNLISKYQKQIDLMQEYRIALISQAVTGKIDVRDWKPQTK